MNQRKRREGVVVGGKAFADYVSVCIAGMLVPVRFHVETNVLEGVWIDVSNKLSVQNRNVSLFLFNKEEGAQEVIGHVPEVV